MKRCLIVFAKEPEAGRVKTRLAQSIGDEKSLNLYKAFLKDVIKIAETVNVEKKILAYDSSSDDPLFLKEVAQGFLFYEQIGNNLGERLSHAFEYAQSLGFEETVIIGSDSPTLPKSFIQQAFMQLKVNDVCLGPCQDGGYYLIGLSISPLGILDNVDWSSDKVFFQTMENAKKLYKRVSILDSWYDIDKYEDIQLLKEKIKHNPESAVFTRDVLKTY